MSLLGQAAVGIDLSDGTLKAVRLVRSGRRVSWTASWRVGCAGENDPALAALDALPRLLAEHPVPASTTLVIAAPSRGIFSRTYLIPAMEGPRLDELVRYEVLAETGRPEDDLVMRHHVRRGALESQALTWALPRAQVDAFRAALEARRIACDALEAPGFALASFVDHELPAHQDRVLLAVGEIASELVLARPAGLWMRHLPLGLQHGEAAELAGRFRAELAAAVAAFLPPDQPFRPEELVLTEEGACDAGFTTALRKATGLHVTRIGALQHIRAARRVSHAGHSPEQALAMGKAFGLALCGLGLGRISAPVATGSPERAALRRVPAVAASVFVASAALVGVGEAARWNTARLQTTLPISLTGSMQDMLHRRDETLAERRQAGAAAEALLALARRRPQVMEPRRALARLSDVFASLGVDRAHLDQLWLATSEPGRAGLMTLTLHVEPALDSVIEERLRAAFGGDWVDARVRGPETVPVSGLSRWLVELALP
jgi:hypothetical protein